MDTDRLIDHVKELISRCGVNDCDEMEKHIESLKELTKYKDMENKSSQSSVNDGKNKNINGNGSGDTSEAGLSFLKEQGGLCKATGRRIMYMAIVFAAVSVGGVVWFFHCFKSELLFMTVFLISYLIFALCFLFVIKYEYSVWMKDRELSNELKKMYYQRYINKQMKDNR